MIKYLLSLYKRRKLKSHVKGLKKSCIWGSSFCKSKFYKFGDFQLLNIRIDNQTNHKDNIKFGDYCNISCQITLNKDGKIEVGDYVFINYAKMRIDYHLKIGSNCMLGPNVILWDTNNHPLSASKRHQQTIDFADDFPLYRSYESDGGDIEIEDDVWIGMDALILGGVKIGKGAVVAARSVVTTDVEPYTLVAGIPAKKISNVPK